MQPVFLRHNSPQVRPTRAGTRLYKIAALKTVT
jgi:hypothetical protein